ncbi:MAG: hypothetical protein HPY85_01865 [Anaerolineae bacterium]|jgi:hypothetical protein|nr:hypothetical protein [Anaerolineae bacterium]
MENENQLQPNADAELSLPTRQAWVTKAFIIGGVIGAVAGLIGAFIFVNNHQDQDDDKLDAATGVQLGLGILGVLRLLTR